MQRMFLFDNISMRENMATFLMTLFQMYVNERNSDF